MSTIPLEQCHSDLQRFGLTQCATCDDLIHQDEAIMATYYQEHMQEQESFCSATCKETWLNERRKP